MLYTEREKCQGLMHLNQGNIAIHMVCVPIILTSSFLLVRVSGS